MKKYTNDEIMEILNDDAKWDAFCDAAAKDESIKFDAETFDGRFIEKLRIMQAEDPSLKVLADLIEEHKKERETIESDFTPEEKALKEALKKAYEKDDRQPSRPLDLSFMEQEPELNHNQIAELKKDPAYEGLDSLFDEASAVKIIKSE